MYSINFTVTKKICLSLHYNGANSCLFVNGTEIYEFKAKDSEIVTTPLCLGNISKNRSTANMKKMDLLGMFIIIVLIMMLLQLMTKKTLKFNNIRVKKTFYMSKEPIDLMSVNMGQIVVSDKSNHHNDGYKYFIGYHEG